MLLAASIKKDLVNAWKIETVATESTLHQLSPYIGKLKSSLAKEIIQNVTKKGDLIYDPYCGAGTIPLEAWALNRRCIGNDLNPYANVLTLAKLFPPNSLEEVLKKMSRYAALVQKRKSKIDLRSVPKWVRLFFHKETLRDTITWVRILFENEEWFILTCLLGILHHQRPGFLSFPSSHAVPYLRQKKYSKEEYPNMYQYRNVEDRLVKKVTRAFRRIPKLDRTVFRQSHSHDSTLFVPRQKVDAIITSPPYMRKLDYARDNRLRLWFLGSESWQELDNLISPTENQFLESISLALNTWKACLKKGGKCVFILGDNYCRSYKLNLPSVIAKIAQDEVKGYNLIFSLRNMIPENRRIRRKHKGNKFESILIFEKE